ncbi:hypothetical protein [Rothia koreensis]|uniref:hypothetical protein n=1 Tax=Rothia koreensis TaxID=592378 RepID=UPI003FCE24AE
MKNKVTDIAFGMVITALSYATHQPVWLTATMAGLTVVLAGVVAARAVIRRER